MRDTQPRRRTPIVPTETTFNMVPVEITKPTSNIENNEISLHYMHTGKTWQREITEVNEYFAFLISKEITNETPNPSTIMEAQKRPDWP